MRESTRAGMERHVVGIAVLRGEAVLILRRRSDDFMPDVWELPGGHVEPGESIPSAVARELFEETGWRLTGILELVDWFDYAGEEGMATREWNFNVTVECTNGLVHPEHQAYAWATLEDYQEYVMTPEMRRTVGKVLSEHVGVAGRGIEGSKDSGESAG